MALADFPLPPLLAEISPVLSVCRWHNLICSQSSTCKPTVNREKPLSEWAFAKICLFWSVAPKSVTDFWVTFECVRVAPKFFLDRALWEEINTMMFLEREKITLKRIEIVKIYWCLDEGDNEKYVATQWFQTWGLWDITHELDQIDK